MPYYNSPMAYQPMYGQPGGYGQTPYNPGGTMQQTAQRYEIIHVNGEPGARAHGVDTPEFYADMAAAFLNDEDAAPNKAGRYYHCVAEG